MPRKKKEEETVPEEELLLSGEEAQEETSWTAFIVPTIILLFVFLFVGSYIYVTRPDTGSSPETPLPGKSGEEQDVSSDASSRNDSEATRNGKEVVYLTQGVGSSVISEVSGAVTELGSYAVVDGYVYYRYNPAESPYVLLIPIDRAAETFSLVDGSRNYATNSEDVYFVRETGLSAPRRNEFFLVKEADAATFKLVAPDSGNTHQSWLARDADHVFYQQNIIPDADPESFTTTDHVSVTMDSDHVFLWYKILPDADPETYEVVFDTSTATRGTVFARDANGCYRDYEQIDCEVMPGDYEEAAASGDTEL